MTDFTAPARITRSLLSPCFELLCLSLLPVQNQHCRDPVLAARLLQVIACIQCVPTATNSASDTAPCPQGCCLSPAPPAQLPLSGTESPNTPALCPAGTLLLSPAPPHPGAQAQSALTATIPYSVSGCSSVNAAWGEEKAAFSVSPFQKL